jgi:hypothetical protein
MATKILIEITGLVLLAWSLKVLLKYYKKPIAVFNFEDGNYPFEIQKAGYYSISVLGAGFIDFEQRVIIKITSGESDASNVRVNYLLFSSTREGQKEVQCWGFSIRHTGNYTISFSNLDQTEGYHYTLRSKRFFESPIDHSKLRILIHRSVKPAYRLAAILALILGVNLIFHGIFNL